jgi:hypothetical protein
LPAAASEDLVQIVRAAGDAPQIFGASVVDVAAPFLFAAVFDAATNSFVASFIDAAAAILWPDEEGDLLSLVIKPMLGHRTAKGYRLAGGRYQRGNVLGQGVEIICAYCPHQRIGGYSSWT